MYYVRTKTGEHDYQMWTSTEDTSLNWEGMGEHVLKVCPACHDPIVKGERYTLVPIGPGKDSDEQAKCSQGRWYNAVAILSHYDCATGLSHPMEAPHD